MSKPIPTGGIARHIDDLGRLVIPKEIRRRLGWREGSLINMSVDGNSITCTKLETEREIDDSFVHLIDLLEDNSPTPLNLQTIKALKELQETYKAQATQPQP